MYYCGIFFRYRGKRHRTAGIVIEILSSVPVIQCVRKVAVRCSAVVGSIEVSVEVCCCCMTIHCIQLLNRG
jgi:hypothetical protein